MIRLTAIKEQRKAQQDEEELIRKNESHKLTTTLQKGNIEKQLYEASQRPIEGALKEQRLVTGDVDLEGKVTENRNKKLRGKLLDFQTDPSMLAMQEDFKITDLAKKKADLEQVGKRESAYRAKVQATKDAKEAKKIAQANAVPFGEPAPVSDVHKANLLRTDAPILNQISQGTDNVPKLGDEFLWRWAGKKESLNKTANMNIALTERIHAILNIPKERQLTLEQHAEGVKKLKEAGEISLEKYSESGYEKWKKKIMKNLYHFGTTIDLA